ncbi:cyclin-dependent kinase inhibitor 1-like [Solanum pennellii]|uniref:Cyclin-dependent kinase inhibitor 1-like n=1 Tax=Solanum pennellii TaxID=28526 RepID=A0ABM1GA82_SOLPN|nr:cyclin-dependent kinase inhibitor 1-like [Solanum pennellii]
MDVPLMMRKKRKICDNYTPVVSSDTYEPDGSSMSCCSSNSKSLDLDEKYGEVAEKEEKSIEEEYESEKMPPVEEFDEIELNEIEEFGEEMASVEEFDELELNEIEEFGEEMASVEEFDELELNEMPSLEEEAELDEMLPPLEEPEPPLIPTTEELEEFFTRHEQRISTRLRQNYNFDFEKEEPLEGPFEWVPIRKMKF